MPPDAQSDSLDLFLGFSAWNEPVSDEPLPGPSPTAISWSRDRELDRIRHGIRESLEREDGISAETPFALRGPVRIAVALERATVENHAVINEICDALRGETPPKKVAGFDDAAAWNKAIRITRRLRRLSGQDLYGIDRTSRGSAVGEACRRIERRGFRVTLTERGPGLDEADISAICRKIDERAAKVGGRRIIDAMLAWYVKAGRTYRGSLLQGRSVSSLPHVREPSIPWHFLYNIAWRHFGDIPRIADDRDEMIALLELARDFAAVFDVEAYDVYDGMFVGSGNLHTKLLDRVLYDELFTLPQWQPEVAGRVYSTWLRHMAASGVDFPLASRKEWDALGGSLIALAQPTTLVVTHAAEHAGHLLSANRATELLEALAIPLDRLNDGYTKPTDTAKRDSAYFPVYRMAEGLYVLPPRGLAARAMFERIYALLRKADAFDLENRMGAALEAMTVDAIGSTGREPGYIGLKYRTAAQRKRDAPYELDVADDRDDPIVLVECKKKALTNAARGGNILSATVDLVDAYLKPLIQMNRHEAELRSGGIDFLNGQRLALNGRSVRRVAITMTDHGSMQDRMFLRALLTGLWGHSLTAIDPKHRKDADKINELLKTFTDGITSLAAQAGGDFNDFVHRYFASSWWFSIDQFMYLCEHAENLGKATAPLGAMVFGTGNLMHELSQQERTGLSRL